MNFLNKYLNLIKISLFIISIIIYCFINRFSYSGQDLRIRTNIFTDEVSILTSGDKGHGWYNTNYEGK